MDSESDSGQGVLIPVILNRYAYHDHLPNARAHWDHLAALLADFGISNAPDWQAPMLDRGADAIQEYCAVWPAHSATVGVLYWVGHGQATRTWVSLAHAKSPNPIGARAGIDPEYLAAAIEKWMRRCEPDGHHLLIVIVDACESNRFVQRLAASLDEIHANTRILLIGAGDDSVVPGRIVDVLDAVIAQAFKTSDEIPATLLLHELDQLDLDLDIRNLRLGTAALRRSIGAPSGLPVDLHNEVVQALSQLPEGDRRHFAPKVKSSEGGETAWFYQGRTLERMHLLHLLRQGSKQPIVLTGVAGSGKSALLGDLVIRSRGDQTAVLLRAGLLEALPPEAPSVPKIDAALNLAGLGLTDVVEELLTQLAIGGTQSDGLVSQKIDHLLHELSSGENSTLVLDALDESTEPLAVANLIRMLAMSGAQVLAACRADQGSTADAPEVPAALLEVLGGDDCIVVQVKRDEEAIQSYVTHRLIHLGAERARLAAEAIRAVGAQFLHARVAVFEILQDVAVLDDSAALGRLVAGDHASLFLRAVNRLASLDPSNEPLLRALALSYGKGLPVLGGTWSAFACRLMGGNVTISSADIEKLVEVAAAPYIIADREGGQTCYRLAHRSFVDALRGDSDERRVSDLILTDACLDLLRRRDIDATVPHYLEQYTSAHAAGSSPEGWWHLDRDPISCDRLNPAAVARDAMRTVFRERVPPTIAGIIGSVHQTRLLPVNERRALRRWAEAMQTGSAKEAVQSGPPSATISLQWARSLPRTPVHLNLAGHAAAIRAIGLRVDITQGSSVLTAGADGTVRQWDPRTGAPTGPTLHQVRRAATRVKSGSGFNGVACGTAPDGTPLITASDADGFLCVWAARTGRPIRTEKVSPRGISCFASHPTGAAVVAIADALGNVKVWNSATGTLIGRLNPGRLGAVTCLALLEDATEGLVVATGHVDGSLVYRSVRGRVAIASSARRDSQIVGLSSVSEDGMQALVSIRKDGIVERWAVRDEAAMPVKVAVGLQDSTAFSANREDGALWVASADAGGTIRIVDDMGGVKMASGHNGRVAGLVWLGDSLLASAGSDALGKVWSAGMYAPEERRMGARVVSVVGSKRGTMLGLFGTNAGGIHFVNPQTGRPLGEMRTEGAVNCIASLPVGSKSFAVATGGATGVLDLWIPDLQGRLTKKRISPAGRCGVKSVHLFGYGRNLKLLAGFEDGRVQVFGWDHDRISRIAGFHIGERLTGAELAVGPLEKELVVVASRSGITRWSLAGFPLDKRPIVTPGKEIRTLAIVANARHQVLVGSAAGAVSVVDSRIDAPGCRLIAQHHATIVGLAASPLSTGDALIVSVSNLGRVEIHRLSDAQLVRRFFLDISVESFALGGQGNALLVASGGTASLQLADLEGNPRRCDEWNGPVAPSRDSLGPDSRSRGRVRSRRTTDNPKRNRRR